MNIVFKDDYEDGDALFERHRPYVELLSRVNNSCVFVSELHVRYLYISPNFNDFFGLGVIENDTVETIGHKLEACIHRDDLMPVIRFQEKALKYIFDLPTEKQADYKHIFELRVTGSDKRYVRIVLQYQLLEIREPGRALIILGVADVSPDQDLESPPKFRLVNFRTGEIIPFDLTESANVNLTKRELEVLKMANKGMFSKEISDRLSISIHTVNRHRQNILEKMNVDNVMEAINHARTWGLIG